MGRGGLSDAEWELTGSLLPSERGRWSRPAGDIRHCSIASASASPRRTAGATLISDGGMKLADFRGRPFTGADPAKGTLMQRGITLPAPASG